MRVQVYKNLHTGNWSIRCKGRVIDHRDEVLLRDCVFHVGESSRQRVIRNRCREVHAWVTGELVEDIGALRDFAWEAITYRPYESGEFIFRANGKALNAARLVYFSKTDGAFVLNYK